ncbi:MAG TPA: energy transducer TonB [Blastocatellia bacterium]|nr:energy transducer TonB [Blastocatellia bacterium]
MKLFAITNVLWVLMVGAPQIDSFEKQALSLAQATPASDLDAKLPERPFAGWLEQVLNSKARGAKAGMIWQLTECGKRGPSPHEAAGSLPACAEIIALLPDKRRVFIKISVGTFKDGLIGKPAFFSAAIEHNDELYLVRQLYDLPGMLRAQKGVSDNSINKRPATKTKNQIPTLPPINAGQAPIITLSNYPLSPPANFSGPTGLEPPPPFPQEFEEVSESALLSRVINRVNPVYSANARKLNATGTVKVEVTISEVGIVIDARAISGHLALRSAAVEAARKWVFKPAILKDTPVKMKGVLTFNFGPGAK